MITTVLSWCKSCTISHENSWMTHARILDFLHDAIEFILSIHTIRFHEEAVEYRCHWRRSFSSRGRKRDFAFTWFLLASFSSPMNSSWIPRGEFTPAHHTVRDVLLSWHMAPESSWFDIMLIYYPKSYIRNVVWGAERKGSRFPQFSLVILLCI